MSTMDQLKAEVRLFSGSVYMVTSLTPAAKAWVEEHVALEGWQWMGPSFAVEPRYLETLRFGAESDGLSFD